MITLADYQILDHLYESTNSLIYRARREADGQAVVLKMLKEAYPTPERMAAFKREYEILSQFEIAGVISVYELRRAHLWLIKRMNRVLDYRSDFYSLGASDFFPLSGMRGKWFVSRCP